MFLVLSWLLSGPCENMLATELPSSSLANIFAVFERYKVANIHWRMYLVIFKRTGILSTHRFQNS